MDKIYNLTIDTKRKSYNKVLGIKQNENNVVLNITLVQNSIALDLTDCTVRLNYLNNGNVLLQMADIVQVKEGKVKVNLLTKVLKKLGETPVDISIFDKDNRKITSSTFIIVVQASIYTNDVLTKEDMDLVQTIHVNEEERQLKEETRQKNEQERIESENNRKNKEKERQEAELKRDTAEKDRSNAETKRITSEEQRVEEETNRIEAEVKRVATENKRVIAETERDTIEKERIAAEKDRVEKEDQRIDNEKSRISQEITRIEQENGRKIQEKDRINKEKQRIEAEKTRVVKEDERAVEETKRVDAENKRIKAEKDRVAAEKDREQTWGTIKDAYEKNENGDMKKAIYDKNNNGIVDIAEDAKKLNGIDADQYTKKEDLNKLENNLTKSIQDINFPVKSVLGKTGKITKYDMFLTSPIVYVNEDMGDDKNDGSSIKPLRTLSEAIFRSRLPVYADATVKIELLSDIHVSEIISNFSGILNGNGHTFITSQSVLNIEHCNIFFLDIIINTCVNIQRSRVTFDKVEINNNSNSSECLLFTESVGHIGNVTVTSKKNKADAITAYNSFVTVAGTVTCKNINRVLYCRRSVMSSEGYLRGSYDTYVYEVSSYSKIFH